MALLEEVSGFNLCTYVDKTVVKCKAFEDNEGALELALIPKLRPRTKHINSKYHHFRSHVRTGKISVTYIDTKQQVADILTKPVEQNLFLHLRKKLMNW